MDRPARPAEKKSTLQLERRARRVFLRFGVPWGAALLVGLVAVWYAQAASAAYAGFLRVIDGRPWLALLITPAATVAATWMTRRWFRGSEGSGIPQVIAALHLRPADRTVLRELFGLRVVLGKLAGSLLGFAGGLSIGREGPTVHIGAALMLETRRFYRHGGERLNGALLLAGAAAGLSAAFNTPLAGVIFAIEELARDFESRTSGTMITAVVFSGLTSLALAGNYLYFGHIVVPEQFGIGFALPVLLAAILCGLLGAAFSWAVLHWERWMPAPLQRWRASRPLIYALLIGLAVAALGVLSGGRSWGSGYDQARQLLDGSVPQGVAFAPIRWVGLVLSYMAGIPGGLFSPSLSVGAGLAVWVHAVFAAAPLPALIALCMAGYMAAVTQSPLTSFVIVMEMTNGTSMVIPLMATSLLSARIAAIALPPLYEALAHKNYAAPSAAAGADA